MHILHWFQGRGTIQYVHIYVAINIWNFFKVSNFRFQWFQCNYLVILCCFCSFSFFKSHLVIVMLHDDLPGSAANHFVRHVIQLCFETPAGDEELFLIQLVQVLQCGTPRRQKSGLEVSTGSAKESQIIPKSMKQLPSKWWETTMWLEIDFMMKTKV